MAKLETLTANFTTQDTTNFQGWDGTNVTVSGGQLSITAQNTYNGINSPITTWDLAASYALVQVNQVPTTYPGGIGLFIELRMGGSGSNLVRWDWSGSNQFTAVRTVGGATTVVGSSVPYAAGTWLRIRESGGTIFWDYSSDGTNWTNTGSWAQTFGSIADARPFIFAGPGGVDRPFLLDNYNLPPANAFVGSLGLSGAGTLAQTGRPAVARSLSLSGAGTLAEAGAPSVAGSLSGTGTGTLASVGLPSVARTLGLSGAGNLARSGAPAVATTLTLGSDATLDEVGIPAPAGTLAGSGSGTLALSGSALSSATGTLALSGSGNLAESATNPGMTAAATYSGEATLGMTGLAGGTLGGDLALSGTGTLARTQSSAAAVGTLAGTGSGALLSNGAPGLAGSRALTGDATTGLAGSSTVARTLALSGAGTQARTGMPWISTQNTASAIGDLQLTPAGITLVAAFALGGAAALNLAGGGSESKDATLSGAATLTLTGVPGVAAVLGLSAAATLRAARGAARAPGVYQGPNRSPLVTQGAATLVG
jgi:hypothetical protein